MSRAQFERGIGRGQALMIGTRASVTDKLLDLHRALQFDRLQALADWGGLPAAAVEASVRQLGAAIAAVLREAATEVPT